MGREIELDRGSVVLQQQICSPPPGGKPGGNSEDGPGREMELALADIVCIFTSPKKPGIMFYDRTPESDKERQKKGIKEGQYLTEKHSISEAQWDEEVNVPNAQRTVDTRLGSVKVITIIVTDKKMKDILEGISKSVTPSRIIIDTGTIIDHLYAEQMMHSNNIDTSKVNYDNFKQVRDEIMKSMELHNRLDNSNIPTFNNTDTSGKGLK